MKNNKKMNDTTQERVDTVNLIIKEIASIGRKFFNHKGVIDKISLINGKISMTEGYSGKTFSLHVKKEQPPKEFMHGGTLWALTKDFFEFIQTGEKTNHNNGYGGLYCSHWGYSEKDMKKIQDLATKLGYL